MLRFTMEMKQASIIEYKKYIAENCCCIMGNSVIKL